MQLAPRRHSGYLFGVLGFLALFALPACGKKDSAPAPEPAPKDVAAETKPMSNDKPLPTAMATAAPATTEMNPPQAAPSASAVAGSSTSPGKSPNAPGTSTEVAAAPIASAQNSPVPAETAVPTAAATPEAPPPPPVESPKQTGQAFSVWLQSSGKYTAGQQGAVEAVVMPKGEFHCNQEYPYKFVTSSLSTGVTFPKSTFRAEGLSLSPNRAVMRIPFVPQSAGEARIGGTFHFSVCTDQQCVVEKRDVFVTVNVQ